MTPKIFRFASFTATALLLTACASSRGLDEAIADITTNATIKGVIFTDRSHDYSDIDLTIYEGRLLLTGTLHTEEGRSKLIENARQASGVKEIIDAIVIGEQTTFRQGLDDTRIDQTLRAKLMAHSGIRSGNYKIAVSNATLHLIGSTHSQSELDKTLELARTISGVKKVNHYVTVHPLDTQKHTIRK